MQKFSSDPDVNARSTRSIDSYYLERLPADNPRPYFPFLWTHIAPELAKKTNSSLIDIGSANGAFLHYCKSQNVEFTAVGVDALGELVSFSQREVPQATFLKADICSRETLPKQKFDLATMLTLHSHFDDPMEWLPNTMNLVKPNGRLFVFGPFNKAPVDTLVRLRKADSADQSWLPGWNLLSRHSISSAVESINCKSTFHEYPGKLAPEKVQDHLSTKSVRINDQDTYANEAGLILDFSLLEIYR